MDLLLSKINNTVFNHFLIICLPPPHSTFIFKTVGGSVQDKNPEVENTVQSDQEKNHSNNSTLSERRLSDSSFCSIEEQHRAVYEMVQQIFLSTRGYVNFVNEIFRQVSVCFCLCAIVTRVWVYTSVSGLASWVHS